MSQNRQNTADEQLIELVSTFPILFDKKLSGFKNKAMKNNTWNEIGNVLEKPGTECQARWIALRDRFTRELRRKECPSGSGAVSEDPWIHMERMSFIKDFIKNRSTIKNPGITPTPSSSPLPETANSEDSLLSPPLPKRPKVLFNDLCHKMDNLIENISGGETNTNTSSSFWKTIDDLTKDLPVIVQDELQTEVFNKVMEKRAEHLHRKSLII